jgi:hypothetical protein
MRGAGKTWVMGADIGGLQKRWHSDELMHHYG